jgi:membrane protein YdbS with pleckstrin-like domain
MWERFHLPLYTAYQQLGEGWRLTLWATSGDILYTAIIISSVAVLVGKSNWVESPSRSELLLSAGLGALVALFVEYKAMYFQTWAYSSTMPIVPLLQVGLSPLLQMTVLTPFAVAVVSSLFRRYRQYVTISP